MNSSNAPRPRPRPRILPAALLLLLALPLAIMSAGGCATTPEARWAQDRSRLTTATNILADLADAGQLSPEAIRGADAAIRGIRGHLARAATRLPEGGPDFNHYMDAARAAFDELWELYLRTPTHGPGNDQATGNAPGATAPALEKGT